ncbi:hypothetical protein CVT26_012811 [Gymnopilus dilepis]|uniref:Uncharacterized protein n=1 Tax=Gymnopilus dilepis TaxID=231916 RepID=A0A409Y454_9AGAR|nr:hypothetical protein CVT26_012811 [Gymnopilus dilepis]
MLSGIGVAEAIDEEVRKEKRTKTASAFRRDPLAAQRPASLFIEFVARQAASTDPIHASIHLCAGAARPSLSLILPCHVTSLLHHTANSNSDTNPALSQHQNS